MKQRKIFRVEDMAKFCTSDCMLASDRYRSSLSDEPVFLREAMAAESSKTGPSTGTQSGLSASDSDRRVMHPMPENTAQNLLAMTPLSTVASAADKPVANSGSHGHAAHRAPAVTDAMALMAGLTITEHPECVAPSLDFQTTAGVGTVDGYEPRAATGSAVAGVQSAAMAAPQPSQPRRGPFKKKQDADRRSAAAVVAAASDDSSLSSSVKPKVTWADGFDLKSVAPVQSEAAAVPEEDSEAELHRHIFNVAAVERDLIQQRRAEAVSTSSDGAQTADDEDDNPFPFPISRPPASTAHHAADGPSASTAAVKFSDQKTVSHDQSGSKCGSDSDDEPCEDDLAARTDPAAVRKAIKARLSPFATVMSHMVQWCSDGVKSYLLDTDARQNTVPGAFAEALTMSEKQRQMALCSHLTDHLPWLVEHTALHPSAAQQLRRDVVVLVRTARLTEGLPSLTAKQWRLVTLCFARGLCLRVSLRGLRDAMNQPLSLPPPSCKHGTAPWILHMWSVLLPDSVVGETLQSIGFDLRQLTILEEIMLAVVLSS